MHRSLIAHLKSKRGVALIYVILIATVVTAAGVILWQSSGAGLRASERNEQQSQAYYNAKSAVEIAVGQILDDIDAAADQEPVTYYGVLGMSQLSTSPIYKSDGTEAHDFSFTLSVAEQDDDILFIIDSVGYGGRSKDKRTMCKITFQITKTDLLKSVEGGGDVIEGEIPPVVAKDHTTNYVLFVRSTIDLSSGSPYIIGQVGTNKGPVLLNYSSRISSDDGGNGILYLGPEAKVEHPQYRTVDWHEIHFEKELEIPAVPAPPKAPEVPKLPELPEDSSIEWRDDILTGGVVDIESGTVQGFEKIELGWNDVLTLRLNGDAVVVADKIESSGTIKLEGRGNLLLIVNKGLDGNRRTSINAYGDSERLVLYYSGKDIELGSGSAIAGTIFAPNADIEANYPTDISGELIVGGKDISFNGLSHDGTFYALNQSANIKYSANRPLLESVTTNIYSNGKKTEIAAAQLAGDIYLNSTEAEFSIYGGSVLSGNVITAGRKVDIRGGALLKGHIMAPNTRSTISITGGAKYGGGIVTGGKSVDVSGGSNLERALIFAPEADVNMDGGVHIIGGIIADTFSATSGTLCYEEMRFDDLPVHIEPTEDESADRVNWRVYGSWIKK
ncbi:MAG: DUF7305 domain-containing protein [Eubacteriales bacterium]